MMLLPRKSALPCFLCFSFKPCLQFPPAHLQEFQAATAPQRRGHYSRLEWGGDEYFKPHICRQSVSEMFDCLFSTSLRCHLPALTGKGPSHGVFREPLCAADAEIFIPWGRKPGQPGSPPSRGRASGQQPTASPGSCPIPAVSPPLPESASRFPGLELDAGNTEARAQCSPWRTSQSAWRSRMSSQHLRKLRLDF